ncbi:MAG: aminomethyl-transferring glycine dehydrogenase subunit GcvPA [Actinomycetia bacterium]|nr:aminomethyl-transferring glycine dehydrogenase subunit GcvPA [Actinomycetes bacterium]
MNYIPVTADERERMLERIGVSAVDELFSDIPKSARLSHALAIGAGHEELEVQTLLARIAANNRCSDDLICFAGGGIYDRYLPALVDNILQRPEFFTAYTPYQPEVSQGTLQAIFEFQTGICELTGLDVANASMYDGATALVEAALMACRVTKNRSRVLAVAGLHPEKIETIQTYSAAGNFSFETAAEIGPLLDETVAAVLIPYPDYHGIIADVSPLIEAAHQVGALAVLDCDPVLLSLLKSPAELGADIATGEAQSLGNPMSLGGPGLGMFACSEKVMRQIPGRLVGKTVDSQGNDAYVLTLATREQHIRREKATSNICSNHALNALAAGVYMAALGPEGLREVALSSCAKAHRLHDELIGTGLFRDRYPQARYGYEFIVDWSGSESFDAVYHDLLEAGILPGIRVGERGLLIAVTEKRSEAELGRFLEEVHAHG